MGADGGTIATSGVVPEVIMRLYREFQAGNLEEAKRIQFKLLELVEAMFAGPIFPEGFRAAAALRGFHLGTSRQPISKKEKADLGQLQSRIACILAECGFAEAAHSCDRSTSAASAPELRTNVEAIVRGVLEQLKS